jgi:hypothetical protein
VKAPKKPPKYTAEQISEITDRVAALRLRWLRFVEHRAKKLVKSI